MKRISTQFRLLLKSKDFIYLPAVYYPMTGKMMGSLGLDAAYVGGYVTGESGRTPALYAEATGGYGIQGGNRCATLYAD